MPYSPPRWLEKLAAILLPPASAEHTLGDLSETSRSTADYLRQLASVLPPQWDTTGANGFGAPLVVLVIFGLIWRLNVAGADWLDRKVGEAELLRR